MDRTHPWHISQFTAWESHTHCRNQSISCRRLWSRGCRLSSEQISPSMTAVVSGNPAEINRSRSAKEENRCPFREIRCVPPCSITASARNPSHLTSKMKSGSSNGKRRFRRGIGWNGRNIYTTRIAGHHGLHCSFAFSAGVGVFPKGEKSSEGLRYCGSPTRFNRS